MPVSTHKRSSSRASQRGVSMVEALVALVVLCVGMLGIAGLYVTSLQANRTALLRTQAVSLVNDMIDRIRANPQARDGYDTSTATPADKGCQGGESNCSYSNLALDDLYRWQEAVKEALPGNPTSTVTVKTSSTEPDQYIVKITWNEPGEPTELSYQGVLNLIAVSP